MASKHEKAIRSKLEVVGGLLEERGEVVEEAGSGDLDSLSRGEVSALMTAEDELSESLHWSRIFPTSTTRHYSQFWSSESYYDNLLQAWEERYGGSQADREQGRDLLRDISQAERIK